MKALIENWQLLSTLFIGTSGGGWLGWLITSKSRKIDFQTKAFKMNSEMLDAVKSDFEDRIKFLKDINIELGLIITEQQDYIKGLRKYKEAYIKKHGKLDDT